MQNKTKFIFSFLTVLTVAIVAIYQFYFPPQKDYVCKDCNVVLISITNLRTNHLSFNDYSLETSPNIDKFAAESLVFKNAFSHASWTLPAGTSLFTSLYPLSHNLMNRYSGEFLSPDITTLTDILNARGYNTVAFTGGFDYSMRFNVINRFSETEIFDKMLEDEQLRYSFARPLRQITNFYGDFSSSLPASIEWLEKNHDNKFFLFVQGFDMHCPFTAPQPYDKMFDNNYSGNINFSTCVFTYDVPETSSDNGSKSYPAHQYQWNSEVQNFVIKNVSLNEADINHLVALYDTKLRSTDVLVGNFLDKIRELGISDKTIIIITSEHGDMLGEKGRFMRGGPLKGTFYEDVLHVPLLIKHPKLESRRINELVQLVDVMPTLLDFLGIKTDAELQGKSVSPVILNNESVNEFVFAASEFQPDEYNQFFTKPTLVMSVRNAEWKLIKEVVYYTIEKDFVESINYELFNLKNDPEEIENVFEEHKNIGMFLDSVITRQFGSQY